MHERIRPQRPRAGVGGAWWRRLARGSRRDQVVRNGGQGRDRPLRACPGRQREQPAEHRCRRSAGRDGRLHRRLRFGQVLARVRHALRGGPAALLRVRGTVRPEAVATGRRTACAGDHRAAAGRGPAAASRVAQLALDGRHHHHAVQSAAHAVLPRRHLSARGRTAGGRVVLTQHRGRRLPGVPRAGRRARRRRGPAGPGPLAEHPRGGDRRLAGRLAGRQPAQCRERPGDRHRPAVAQAQEEGPGLAAVHGRAALRVRRAGAGPRRLRLPGHVLERPQARHARPRRLQERQDARTGAPVRQECALPRVPRQRTAARGARRDLRRTFHRRDQRDAADRGRGAAAARHGAVRGRRRHVDRPVRGDDRGRGPDLRRSGGAGRRTARPGPRISQPRAPLDDPVARRGAAPADRHPAALGAVRRRLRARRTLRGPAPGRRGTAAGRAGPPQGGGQFAVRRGARHGRRTAGGLGGRHRPRRGRGRRTRAVQRPGRRS